MFYANVRARHMVGTGGWEGVLRSSLMPFPPGNTLSSLSPKESLSEVALISLGFTGGPENPC